MPTTIGLEFETHLDLDFIGQGVAINLIRIIASLQLETTDGWTRKYKALVDTGNPISVVPNSVWNKAKIKYLLPHKSELRGIGAGKVSGKLGEITLVFVDNKTTSPPIRVKALLLDREGKYPNENTIKDLKEILNKLE